MPASTVRLACSGVIRLPAMSMTWTSIAKNRFSGPSGLGTCRRCTGRRWRPVPGDGRARASSCPSCSSRHACSTGSRGENGEDEMFHGCLLRFRFWCHRSSESEGQNPFSIRSTLHGCLDPARLSVHWRLPHLAGSRFSMIAARCRDGSQMYPRWRSDRGGRIVNRDQRATPRIHIPGDGRSSWIDGSLQLRIAVVR